MNRFQHKLGFLLRFTFLPAIAIGLPVGLHVLLIGWSRGRWTGTQLVQLVEALVAFVAPVVLVWGLLAVILLVDRSKRRAT